MSRLYHASDESSYDRPRNAKRPKTLSEEEPDDDDARHYGAENTVLVPFSMVDVNRGREVAEEFSMIEESARDCPELRDIDRPYMKIINRTVCFGTLCEVKCQFSTSRGRQLASALERLSTNLSETLKLVQLGGSCIIETSEKVELGLMNHKTASALSTLRSSCSERPIFEARLTKGKIHESIGAYLNGKIGIQFSIDINVTGSDQNSEAIGKILSEHRLYLQKPYFLPLETEYCNPQYLSIADSFEDDDQGTCFGQEDSTELPTDIDAERGSLENVLSTIFDNSLQQSEVDCVETTSNICTKLMIHQRQAVEFLISRENDTISAAQTLWLKGDPEDGQKVYRHKITGVKSPTPTDTLGGILADDMGLGKTLSMITTIVTTLQSAKTYARLEETRKSTQQHKPTQATLVVVPSALLLDNWLDEIDKHVVPGTVRCHRYHGLMRRLDLEKMGSYDVVLSTYGTVAADHSQNRGLLSHVHWYRIILDEAHTIRNWSTKQFHAINELHARSRWCMTGTPVQNSLEDLGALIRFIRLPSLEDPAKFRRHITGGTTVAGRLANPGFENLQTVLASICIRRPNSLLSLPGIEFEECRPVLSLEERHQYNKLLRECYKAIDKTFECSQGEHGILESLLRLRLFCNGGMASVAGGKDFLSPNDKIFSILQQTEDASCFYCRCEILSLNSGASGEQQDGTSIVTCCRRLVCSECLPTYKREVSMASSCPTSECTGSQSPLTEGHEGASPPAPSKGLSTKITTLLKNVRDCGAAEKCLIYSTWRKTLDAIGECFDEEKIQYVRLDGLLSQAQRKESLAHFRRDGRIQALLVTFGTGSTGLNDLVDATRIHILEPQWNPWIESQAIGRLYRHGQTKQVQVIRYICRNTVEEAVESRQLRKIDIAHRGGLEASKRNRRNETKVFVALKQCLENYMTSEDFLMS